jgi:hypothetical protein
MLLQNLESMLFWLCQLLQIYLDGNSRFRTVCAELPCSILLGWQCHCMEN